jgi:hypothetical protein
MLIMNRRRIKTSHSTKRETARFSLKMVMIGQLKKRKPSTNIKIQISLLIEYPGSQSGIIVT